VKRLLFALTLAALLQCAASAQAQQPSAPKTPAPPQTTKREELKAVPDEVFNHELKDLDGRSFFLSNYRGQVFVLVVWASWCAPCRTQVAELNKLYEDYSKRGVRFVGLTPESPTEDAKAVRDALDSLKVAYRIGWGDESTIKALLVGNNAIPQTFVVAPDGHVVKIFVGNSKAASQILRDSIEKTLNPAPTQ
jgi:peroxiredoxin